MVSARQHRPVSEFQRCRHIITVRVIKRWRSLSTMQARCAGEQHESQLEFSVILPAIHGGTPLLTRQLLATP